MVSTRSSPKKASKASKGFKGSKSTPRAAAKAPVEVAKPRRASELTPKARNSQQRRPLTETSSPGTNSPNKIPETDLDTPEDLHLRIIKLERRLAKWEDGKNSHSKGQRVIDNRSRC